jgi:hypothetical protein
MTARPVLAAVVKQTLANIFPNRMRPVQFHIVEPLDLHDLEAPHAFVPQQLSGHFSEAPLLDRKPRFAGCARIRQDAILAELDPSEDDDKEAGPVAS